MNKKNEKSDLELMEKVCEQGSFLDPRLLRDIRERGLYRFINYLPNDKEEAKAVLYNRLSAAGITYDNPEIDHIASKIKRLDSLRDELCELEITESHKVKDLLERMNSINDDIVNYFKR